jgi:hypothetical protein
VGEAMKRKLTFSLICIVVVLASPFVVGNPAHAVTIYLEDIDSGLTSPTGSYRWLDVANQAYSENYRSNYDYTEDSVEVASVEVVYDAIGNTLHGTLTAVNLKPNFAYQLKLADNPDIDADSNERIGLAGRWWQEQWDGSKWTNGQNLNSKGDGSSPSPNDITYFARRDIADSSSPTGLHYRYTGYLLFDYFITDENGDATVNFVMDSSYHVLWATNDSDGNDGKGHRNRSDDDGPLKSSTFDADLSSAYDDSGGDDYPSRTVHVFGEWERLTVGGIFLQPGDYVAEIILTEESFHGSGGTYAGNWAAAMGASIDFSIVTSDVVTIVTAKYKAKPQQLLVEATSSSQPDAVLTIDVYGMDYGIMTFDSTNNKYVFRQKIPGPVENVTVSSNFGGTDTVDLGEAANTPPIADAGGDYQVTDSDENGTETVILDGSGSFDPDGIIQTYEWKEGGIVLRSTVTLERGFSLGTHFVSLTVTDDKGAADSDTAMVNVLPMDGPDLVTILRAEYTRKTKRLLVEATSSAQPDAALTLEGYGPMTFSGDDGTYIFDSKVGNLRKGATVTVTSSYGGLATAPVDFQ